MLLTWPVTLVTVMKSVCNSSVHAILLITLLTMAKYSRQICSQTSQTLLFMHAYLFPLIDFDYLYVFFPQAFAGWPFISPILNEC